MKKSHTKIEIIETASVKKRADTFGSPVESIGVGMISTPYTPGILADMSSINTYHGRCINLKAQLAVGLGYELQPKEGAKESEKEKNIWNEFEKLHALKTGQEFLETLVNWCVDFETFGNGFLEVVRNNAGKLAELYHLGALSCSFVREETGKKKDKVVYLRQMILDNEVKFKKFGEENPKDFNEFIQLKQYTPLSKYYGVPEWMTALAAMYLDRNANTFNIKRFENNLVLDLVILMSGGKLDPQSRKDIKSYLERNFKGVDNVGKALLLNSEESESKIDIKQIAESVKEASYHVMRIDNREEVVDAHGVPRRLVGLTRAGGLGDANQTREEMNMFRNVCLQPRQKRVEFIFNTFILPAMGIANLTFRLNRLESGAEDLLDAQYFQTLTTKNIDGESILDIAEAREGLGYEPRTTDLKKQEDVKAEQLVKALVRLRTLLKAVE